MKSITESINKLKINEKVIFYGGGRLLKAFCEIGLSNKNRKDKNNKARIPKSIKCHFLLGKI